MSAWSTPTRNPRGGPHLRVLRATRNMRKGEPILVAGKPDGPDGQPATPVTEMLLCAGANPNAEANDTENGLAGLLVEPGVSFFLLVGGVGVCGKRLFLLGGRGDTAPFSASRGVVQEHCPNIRARGCAHLRGMRSVRICMLTRTRTQPSFCSARGMFFPCIKFVCVRKARGAITHSRAFKGGSA